jgi:selenocysteine lyase/cysteine desulfurase
MGMSILENEFDRFRRNIVGAEETFQTPYGRQQLLYADWIASGRLYGPIEARMAEVFGPWVGNTHTEASVTGTTMTHAYHEARSVIKRHVNAGPGDAIIAAGSGMTGVINKLQRILGLRVPEKLLPYVSIPDSERPVVFITHMEHHSNQTSWLETIADVEWLLPKPDGTCCLDTLADTLSRFPDRRKIGSFTACSNVTGVTTPYHQMARIMHEHGGLCFVDFAASAPYYPIDMHPAEESERLDAIFFSPHKFLGGPGSAGIMVFDAALDENAVPDHPGGGTVDWTNPWGEHRFVSNLEDREDGGTPAFLQTIRAALAVRLKEEMGCERMKAREVELLDQAFRGLRKVPGLVILADHLEERLGIVSFYLEDIHYNLVVKLLNDRYGIQVRGGCSCAGTYGHYLLHVDAGYSHSITDRINAGDLSDKPGWVRLSLHPTMKDSELERVIAALGEIATHHAEWKEEYQYDPQTNEYAHALEQRLPVEDWFELGEEESATA